LTKRELINEVAETTGIKKMQTEKIINEAFNAIKRSLIKGEVVTITGFGTFKIIKILPRKGWNPVLKKKVVISEKQKIRFAPSIALHKGIYAKGTAR